MKRIILFLIALLAFMPVTTFAQGFVSILNRLNDLEKQFSALETDQKKDAKKLERRIANIQPSSDVNQLQSRIDGLQSDISTLRTELTTAQAQSEEPESQDAVQALTTDIRELIKTLKIQPQSPVSAEPIHEPTPVETAHNASMSGLQISGFGDFNVATEQSNKYRIGQAEVDLEATLDDRIVVGAAIAYDGEGFALGAFTTDFHLWGNNNDHFWLSRGIQSSGLIVGQFDVPFGIDYNVYTSIDRKLVSVPLVVEQTHDCWNDVGAQLYVNTSWANAVVYGTNGFSHDESNLNKMSLGGRLGIRPLHALEVGGSLAGFLEDDNQWGMLILGGDVQLDLGPLALKGEYIVKQTGLSSQHKTTHKGYYGQGMLTVNRLFFVNRFGRFTPDNEASTMRMSTGIGWVIQEDAEFRTEYQTNFDAPDATYLQFVVGF